MLHTPTSLSESPGIGHYDPSDLRVTRIRALRGPNYWRLAPVIACDIAMGPLEKVTSAEIPGFTSRLVGAVPSLESHKCTRGHRSGFIERLYAA